MAKKNSVASHGPSVVDDIAAVEMLASQGLAVHPHRCVRVRNRHASCRRCADACTSGAIAVEAGQWHIDPELCVGCGTCATVCPTCALEAQHPNDASLLRQAKESAAKNQGTALICCQKAKERIDGDAAAAVEVLCLSRIEETLLFSLAAAGVKRVYGLCDTCEDCPRKQGVVSIETVQRTASHISEVWGTPLDYVVSRDIPAWVAPAASDETEAPVGVAANAAAAGQAASAGQPKPEVQGCGAAEAAEVDIRPAHVQKDGTLPHFVPTRRIKLLDALERLGEPVEEELDTRLWGHVAIDFSRCQSCKMCAVFCPTGAIVKFHDEHGIAGIEHYLAECVHCCLCQDICPAQAISCVTQVPSRQLAAHETERYYMADPDWMAGPDQILQRMRVKIGGQSVEHSY